MTDKPAPRHRTVPIREPVHRALRLATVAGRQPITQVIGEGLKAWLENGRAVPPEEDAEPSESVAYLDPEIQQRVKVACAELRIPMALVANYVAIAWLKNHGHQKLLDRFVAEAREETG